MRRFVQGDGSVFILKGYAGTGKTTLIRELCGYLEGDGHRVPLLMAPTGRAAKVLGERTARKATTIHVAIYHREEFKAVSHDSQGRAETGSAAAEADMGVDDMKVYFGINKLPDRIEAKRVVLVVDEASMVSSKPSPQEIFHFGTDVLMDDLLTFAQLESGSKIIFVGDPAQLPPVGDNYPRALSEDFFKERGLRVEGFTLTQVVRQKGESAILRNAMKVRALLTSTTRNELVFETKEKEVTAVPSASVVDEYVAAHPRPALGQSVVICYSNRRAQMYNKEIRKRYFACEGLQKGDVLQVVRNNYHLVAPAPVPSNGGFLPPADMLFNGDFIRVIDEPGAVETRSVPVWTGRGGKRERTRVELQFQEVVFETDRGGVGSAKILTTLLENSRPQLSHDESVALFIDVKMRNPSLCNRKELLADALLKDAYFNALQVKYGYAITGHKSQGGEWDTVFVDYTGRTGLDNDSLRWSYTATTRASKCLFGVDMPCVTPFNKFSIGPVQQVSKADGSVICVKDVGTCAFLPGATAERKAKCLSIVEAMEGTAYKVVKVDAMQYRDRYTVEGPSGQREYDCVYNAAGLFTKYASLQPSCDDEEVLCLLRDERCYRYDTDYSPSEACLEKLHRVVVSAADELGIPLTGVNPFPDHFYVLYGFKTDALFAWLKFFFDAKGFITHGMAASAAGPADDKLRELSKRIVELACPQYE